MFVLCELFYQNPMGTGNAGIAFAKLSIKFYVRALCFPKKVPILEKNIPKNTISFELFKAYSMYVYALNNHFY